MTSIYNVISFFPNKLVSLGSLARDQVINAVGSIGESLIETVDSIAEPIIQSIADKLEALPESHPRAMDVIEPMLLHLFNFSNKYPKLSEALSIAIITITLIGQVLLLVSITLVFPSLTIPVGISAPLCATFCGLVSILLYASVKSELEQRYLNKSDNITHLGAAFFNIDSQSVSQLNAWSAEERIAGNSHWRAVRNKLVRFFSSPSCLLDLDSSELHSLPDILDTSVFRNLNFLYLRNNHLTDLPPSIINLQSLTTLNLSRNLTLERLPEGIFQLPPGCTVNINNCNFSEAELERIGNRVNHLNYSGPRIRYSLTYNNHRGGLRTPIRELLQRLHEINVELNESEQIPSVEGSLRNLYTISDRPYRELPNLTEIPCLEEWLHKLFNTADFRGQFRQTVANRIIDYLERANEDPSYREIFSATLLDAVNSCGDRVTLSVLKLGVTYQLSIVDESDTQKIHHLLTRGTWALDLLHEIARQKISSMRFVDEIEVYLGYPVKLKEELKLPIEVGEMLYFRFSSLTRDDLELAKNVVLTTLNNEEEHLNFLISQPKWIDTLKLNYRDQYRAIEEKRQRDSDAATDSNNLEKHVEIDLVYKQEIRNLTRQVIHSF